MKKGDKEKLYVEFYERLAADLDAKIMELARQTVYQMPAGELIDKFIVCHTRMWNLEEKITSLNEDDSVVAQASRQLRLVNSERARLREEINRRFDGYEVGTEKSYMMRMDLLKGELKDDSDGEEEE